MGVLAGRKPRKHTHFAKIFQEAEQIALLATFSIIKQLQVPQGAVG